MTVSEWLPLLGLDETEQLVFEALVAHPWLTALGLSRVVPVKRSTLYRMLENLKEKGLIVDEVGDNTTYYSVSGPEELSNLVYEQEIKLTSVKEAITGLTTDLSTAGASAKHQTSLRFYRGQTGLRQMEWRMTQTPKTTVYIFDSGQWSEVLGRPFSEKIREEIVRQDIRVLELSNKPKKIHKDGKSMWTQNSRYLTRHYAHRKIDKKILPMDEDIYVFGDTIQFHGYKQHDRMGIEMINKDFAVTLTRLFILAWQRAKPVDRFGGENIS